MIPFAADLANMYDAEAGEFDRALRAAMTAWRNGSRSEKVRAILLDADSSLRLQALAKRIRLTEGLS